MLHSNKKDKERLIMSITSKQAEPELGAKSHAVRAKLIDRTANVKKWRAADKPL